MAGRLMTKLVSFPGSQSTEARLLSLARGVEALNRKAAMAEIAANAAVDEALAAIRRTLAPEASLSDAVPILEKLLEQVRQPPEPPAAA
ncbi:MAG: hypothetical protein AB7P02_15755 [Alphaproteobacteria bacterium]